MAAAAESVCNVYGKGGGRLHASPVPGRRRRRPLALPLGHCGPLREVGLDFRVQYGGKMISVDSKGLWEVKTRAV